MHGDTREKGKNRLPETRTWSWSQALIGQIRSPILFLLFFAAALSLSLGNSSDAWFILIIILINLSLSLWQERKAAKSLSALKKLTENVSRIRLPNGDVISLPSDDLLPGDHVLLETGERLPADGKLVEVQNLEIDESLLTGESVPVEKKLGDAAYRGTYVLRGRGVLQVEQVGLETSLGKIAQTLKQGPSADTPLMLRLNQLNKKIAFIFVLGSLIAVPIVVWLQQLSLTETLSFVIALAVSAIPEGLPIAVTIALALAAVRMSKKHVVVKHLPAVEALGSCTLIASDKTGTLTVNQLTVEKVYLAHTQETLAVPGQGLELTTWSPAVSEVGRANLRDFLICAHWCNEARWGQGLTGRPEMAKPLGDAMDVALLVLAHKASTIYQVEERHSYPLVDHWPYESARALAAALYQVGPKQYRLVVKGALEKIQPLGIQTDTQMTEALTEQAHSLAAGGYRVLLLADRQFTHEGSHSPRIEEEFHSLRLLGLAAVADPLRPEAREAVADMKRAGVQVKMLTGDHPLTAFAIGQQLGLCSSLEEVVTAGELEIPDPEDRRQKLQGKSVFARLKPEHKWQLVDDFIHMGHFVAVTGDGANDAPALKRAHLGVAMGRSGTELARDTADLVLLDDHFRSLRDGILEGRVAYSNIRKIIYLLIGTGLAEVFLFVTSLFLRLPLPLNPAQILWLNVVTNGVQDKALAWLPAQGDELDRPPRSPQEPIFNALMVYNVITMALSLAVVAALYFYHLVQGQGLSVTEARHWLLVMMVLSKNMMLLSVHHETGSMVQVFKQAHKRWLFGAAALAFGLHMVAIQLPFFRDFLGATEFQWARLLEAAGAALLVGLSIEGFKAARRIFKASARS